MLLKLMFIQHGVIFLILCLVSKSFCIHITGYVGNLIKHNLRNYSPHWCNETKIELRSVYKSDAQSVYIRELVFDGTYITILAQEPLQLDLLVVYLHTFYLYTKICYAIEVKVIIQSYMSSLQSILFSHLNYFKLKESKKFLECKKFNQIYIQTFEYASNETLPLSILLMQSNLLVDFFKFPENLLQVLPTNNSYSYFNQLSSLDVIESNVLRPMSEGYMFSWPIGCQHNSHISRVFRRSVKKIIEPIPELSLTVCYITKGYFKENMELFFGSISALVGTPIETTSASFQEYSPSSSKILQETFNKVSITLFTSQLLSKVSTNIKILSSFINESFFINFIRSSLLEETFISSISINSTSLSTYFGSSFRDPVITAFNSLSGFNDMISVSEFFYPSNSFDISDYLSSTDVADIRSIFVSKTTSNDNAETKSTNVTENRSFYVTHISSTVSFFTDNYSNPLSSKTSLYMTDSLDSNLDFNIRSNIMPSFYEPNSYSAATAQLDYNSTVNVKLPTPELSTLNNIKKVLPTFSTVPNAINDSIISSVSHQTTFHGADTAFSIYSLDSYSTTLSGREITTEHNSLKQFGSKEINKGSLPFITSSTLFSTNVDTFLTTSLITFLNINLTAETPSLATFSTSSQVLSEKSLLITTTTSSYFPMTSWATFVETYLTSTIFASKTYQSTYLVKKTPLLSSSFITKNNLTVKTDSSELFFSIMSTFFLSLSAKTGLYLTEELFLINPSTTYPLLSKSFTSTQTLYFTTKLKSTDLTITSFSLTFQDLSKNTQCSVFSKFTDMHVTAETPYPTLSSTMFSDIYVTGESLYPNLSSMVFSDIYGAAETPYSTLSSTMFFNKYTTGESRYSNLFSMVFSDIYGAAEILYSTLSSTMFSDKYTTGESRYTNLSSVVFSDIYGAAETMSPNLSSTKFSDIYVTGESLYPTLSSMLFYKVYEDTETLYPTLSSTMFSNIYLNAETLYPTLFSTIFSGIYVTASTSYSSLSSAVFSNIYAIIKPPHPTVSSTTFYEISITVKTLYPTVFCTMYSNKNVTEETPYLYVPSTMFSNISTETSHPAIYLATSSYKYLTIETPHTIVSSIMFSGIYETVETIYPSVSSATIPEINVTVETPNQTISSTTFYDAGLTSKTSYSNPSKISLSKYSPGETFTTSSKTYIETHSTAECFSSYSTTPCGADLPVETPFLYLTMFQNTLTAETNYKASFQEIFYSANLTALSLCVSLIEYTDRSLIEYTDRSLITETDFLVSTTFSSFYPISDSQSLLDTSSLTGISSLADTTPLNAFSNIFFISDLTNPFLSKCAITANGIDLTSKIPCQSIASTTFVNLKISSSLSSNLTVDNQMLTYSFLKSTNKDTLYFTTCMKTYQSTYLESETQFLLSTICPNNDLTVYSQTPADKLLNSINPEKSYLPVSLTKFTSLYIKKDTLFPTASIIISLDIYYITESSIAKTYCTRFRTTDFSVESLYQSKSFIIFPDTYSTLEVKNSLTYSTSYLPTYLPTYSALYSDTYLTMKTPFLTTLTIVRNYVTLTTMTLSSSYSTVTKSINLIADTPRITTSPVTNGDETSKFQIAPSTIPGEAIGFSYKVSARSSQMSISNTYATPLSKDNRPQLIKPIEFLFPKVGYYFVFKVPAEMFIDSEDGNVRNLTLKCVTSSGVLLDSNPWLTFNTTLQLLEGIPLTSDYFNQELGGLSLQLIAFNSRNNFAINNFKIFIIEAAALRLSLIITFKLSIDYTAFISRKDQRVKLVQKISKYFRDSESYVYLSSLRNGSTIVDWSNTSFLENVCDNETILEFIKKVQIPNSNSPQPSFFYFLSPEFPLLAVSSNAQDLCTTFPQSISQSKQENFLLYLIPIILLSLLVIVLITILLVIYKKIVKRKNYIRKGREYCEQQPPLFSDKLDLKYSMSDNDPSIAVVPDMQTSFIGPCVSRRESANFDDEKSSISEDSIVSIVVPPYPPPAYLRPLPYIKGDSK
ncbi:mucin-2 isoform X2 [Hydra vulgaris]|uniref:mucin-2 isoform X2 n=1 Tax=Hydra vulgaris TaxID=6087 RepID=UPI0032EA5A89